MRKFDMLRHSNFPLILRLTAFLTAFTFTGTSIPAYAIPVHSTSIEEKPVNLLDVQKIS